MFKQLSALIPFIGAFGNFGFAEETTAEIQVVVTNANGSKLAGAGIIAVHLPTNTTSSTDKQSDFGFMLTLLTKTSYKKAAEVNILLPLDFW